MVFFEVRANAFTQETHLLTIPELRCLKSTAFPYNSVLCPEPMPLFPASGEAVSNSRKKVYDFLILFESSSLKDDLPCNARTDSA